MPDAAKPRLILNNCDNDLRTFEAYVASAKLLKDDFDLRIVINHLHRPHWEERPDREDPYPLYFIGFPTFKDFVFHKTLSSVQHPAFVRGNVRLMRAKAAILEKHRMKGAFVGLEPIYLREVFYERFPSWRGPRVDHPRRSREPLFAPCLHMPEVQELYATMVAALVKQFPVLDTFYFPCTNDSGAGFCHYAGSYFGPNGPARCRSERAAAAVAAFHRAVLEGARRGGARAAVTLMANAGRAWRSELMPSGAHHFPSDRKEAGSFVIQSDLTCAYPVRYLSDPLRLLEEVAVLPKTGTPILAVWFGDCYSRVPADTVSVDRLLRLFLAVWRNPEKASSLTRRLDLLESHLAEEFGNASASRALEGFVALSQAFRLQADNPMRLRTTTLPMYGSVSHRWLTRPFVAIPEALTPQEEDEVLKHAFCAFGPAGRRNLLDLHGKLAINPAGDYDQFSAGIDLLIRGLDAARNHFLAAAQAARKGAPARTLSLYAKSARTLALIWRNCRNALEFAALRDNAQVMPEAQRGAPVDKGGGDLGWMSPYHKIVYRVLRSELDVLDELLPLVKNDAERVVGRADKPANEDTLLLGPNLAGQLVRKRQIMLRHWQDVLRLEPLKERPFGFTYW